MILHNGGTFEQFIEFIIYYINNNNQWLFIKQFYRKAKLFKITSILSLNFYDIQYSPIK